jgi:hypothetical protein
MTMVLEQSDKKRCDFVIKLVLTYVIYDESGMICDLRTEYFLTNIGNAGLLTLQGSS